MTPACVSYSSFPPKHVEDPVPRINKPNSVLSPLSFAGSLFSLRIGVSVKQQFTEEEIYKDRDSQIAAIEKTFEDAQKSVSHPGLHVIALHLWRAGLGCQDFMQK